MSIVVATLTESVCLMCTDKRATFTNGEYSDNIEKGFKVGNILIGFVGDYAFVEVLIAEKGIYNYNLTNAQTLANNLNNNFVSNDNILSKKYGIIIMGFVNGNAYFAALSNIEINGLRFVEHHLKSGTIYSEVLLDSDIDQRKNKLDYARSLERADSIEYIQKRQRELVVATSKSYIGVSPTSTCITVRKNE